VAVPIQRAISEESSLVKADQTPEPGPRLGLDECAGHQRPFGTGKKFSYRGNPPVYFGGNSAEPNFELPSAPCFTAVVASIDGRVAEALLLPSSSAHGNAPTFGGRDALPRGQPDELPQAQHMLR
jgi:hypothetical protein